MWVELGHCHFLYVPAVLNVVTIGNSTGLKMFQNGTVGLGLSLVSSLLSTALLPSVYGAISVAKVNLLDTVYCKFSL